MTVQVLEIAIWGLLVLAVLCWVVALARRQVTAWFSGPGRLPEWPIAVADFLLLLLLIIVFASTIPYLVVRFLGLELGPPSPPHTVLIHNLALPFAILAAITLFRLHWSGRPESGDMRPLPAFVTGLIGWLLAMPAVLLAYLVWSRIVIWAGWPDAPQDAVTFIRDAESTGELASWALLVVVAAPIWEELVFRGAIFRFLASRLPWGWAALISSVVFAALHDNVVSFLPLVVLGFALALVYRRTGRLEAPIAMHMVFNLLTLVQLLAGPRS